MASIGVLTMIKIKIVQSSKKEHNKYFHDPGTNISTAVPPRILMGGTVHPHEPIQDRPRDGRPLIGRHVRRTRHDPQSAASALSAQQEAEDSSAGMKDSIKQAPTHPKAFNSSLPLRCFYQKGGLLHLSQAFSFLFIRRRFAFINVCHC